MHPKFGLVGGVAALVASVFAITWIYTYTQAGQDGVDPFRKLMDFDLKYCLGAFAANFHFLDLLFLFVAFFFGFYLGHREYPEEDRIGFFFND